MILARLKTFAAMSGKSAIEPHYNLPQTQLPNALNAEAIAEWERKKETIRNRMEVFEPIAYSFSQRILRCARFLFELPNLMVEGDRTEEIQEIIDITPAFDEKMDVSQLITYNATSMRIFIWALKLQDTTSQFINKDIYTDLNLTDR